MRLVFSLIFLIFPFGALAEGFAVYDLNDVNVDADQFAGGTYDLQQKRKRLILACMTCDDLTAVNVILSTAPDDTETRFRSGETTVEDMEAICKQNDKTCTLTAVEVGKAVGWVTQYKLGPNEGSTAVLFLDGDMLTIRSLSESRNRVGSNMATALAQIAPQIVGE
jgi:hypothetical protein